jgi:hypothetical protein
MLRLLADRGYNHPGSSRLRGSTTINNCKAWDSMPPASLTAAQRATAITAILGGTVATEADALALMRRPHPELVKKRFGIF